MSEFKGKAGTIYTETGGIDGKWEAWFEDFCILGVGNSELESLDDAVRHASDIAQLASEAAIKVSRAKQGKWGS